MKVELKVNLKIRNDAGQNQVIIKGKVFDDKTEDFPQFVKDNMVHFKVLDATVTVREEVKEPAKTEEVKEPAKTEEVKEPAKTAEVKEPAKAAEVKANDAGGAGPAGAEIKPVRRRSPAPK